MMSKALSREVVRCMRISKSGLKDIVKGAQENFTLVEVVPDVKLAATKA